MDVSKDKKLAKLANRPIANQERIYQSANSHFEVILFLVEIEKSGSPWDNPRIEKKHLRKEPPMKENTKKRKKPIMLMKCVWQEEFAAFRKLIFAAPLIPELTVHSRMSQPVTGSGKDQ